MGRLFQRLCEFLWNKEQFHHVADWMPFNEFRPRLSKLAFEMVESDESTRIPDRFAETYLGGQFPIHTALGANILAQSEAGLRFFHQRIQEYFAASELIRLGTEALSERLSARWRDVVIAAAGLTCDPEGFVGCIRDSDNTLLAGECLASGVEVSPALSGKIERELSERLNYARRQVVQKEIERHPESQNIIEDRVDDYFGSYDSLQDLIRKVRDGEVFVQKFC
jgi:hypothetical protein